MNDEYKKLISSWTTENRTNLEVLTNIKLKTEIDELNCIKLVFKYFDRMYYLFQYPYSDLNIEQQIKEACYMYSTLSYNTLKHFVNFPKQHQHCIEATYQWLINGPSCFYDTRTYESMHSQCRKAQSIDNNKNINYFIAKLDWQMKFIRHISTGGIFLDGKQTGK